MPHELWWIWIIIAALFAISEVFTAGFFILWFGIAAAVAGILAFLGVGIVWQWVAFIIVSGILIAISRRFADRMTKSGPSGIGADRLIGKIGIVLEDINNVENIGRVRIDKDEWRADSETEHIIKKGTHIIVTRLDGTHVVVKEHSKGE
ncbi:NfeD family protein [candidate division WOR-3 bacterium]|nr:NfeD family protein [candidate division WOR-3 bacterium]